MSQTLYRKYRPQTFSEVVGQNHIKITLQNEILTGQITHAYLFTGPHGIGKTSMARILAKALNCHHRKQKEFEPCNKCHSCEEITKGKSLDLIEIDAATHTQVDKVRENIVANVNFPPHNKYKIFIIDEVHMLSLAAFNALLKTLEEPPEFIVFILCTTQVYKLPETIISRCQRFDFKKVASEQIVNKLKKIITQEKIKINNEVLSTIALRSGGFMRDAESLLGQVVSILPSDKKPASPNQLRQSESLPRGKAGEASGRQGGQITLKDVEAILPRSDLYAISDLVDSLINNNAQKGVAMINKLVSDGVDLERFNLDFIDYLHQMILGKIGLKSQDYSLTGLPEEIKNKLIDQVEKIEISKLIKILEKFMTSQSALKEAEITQLPLEIAVVELCEQTPKSSLTPRGVSVSSRDKNLKTEELKNLRTKEQNTTLTPKPENTTSSNVNIKIVKNIWPEIINQSQEINHTLPLILKSAYPLSINNNQLELGFEFEIHVKKMREGKYLSVVEQTLEKISGIKLKIKPVILPQEKLKELKMKHSDQPRAIDNNQIEEIAKSFGGKVVE